MMAPHSVPRTGRNKESEMSLLMQLIHLGNRDTDKFHLAGSGKLLQEWYRKHD
jgi:hypothetical protein